MPHVLGSMYLLAEARESQLLAQAVRMTSSGFQKEKAQEKD